MVLHTLVFHTRILPFCDASVHIWCFCIWYISSFWHFNISNLRIHQYSVLLYPILRYSIVEYLLSTWSVSKQCYRTKYSILHLSILVSVFNLTLLCKTKWSKWSPKKFWKCSFSSFRAKYRVLSIAVASDPLESEDPSFWLWESSSATPYECSLLLLRRGHSEKKKKRLSAVLSEWAQQPPFSSTTQLCAVPGS